MVRTLRRRFIVSHVLPLLLIVPLLALALIYVLENQVLISDISQELLGEATLIAERTTDYPAIWQNRGAARQFTDRVAPSLTARLMLFDAEGMVLASSVVTGTQPGESPQLSGLTSALSGETSVVAEYFRSPQAEVADAFVPVLDPQGGVMGVVRVSRDLTTVYQRFLRLRYLILIVLAVGLAVGAGAGIFLAVDLERPLRHVTEAVYELAASQAPSTISEEGPEEVRVLAQAFNYLAQRLQHLEKARRQLLSNLVHELGRPLGAMQSGVQALLGGADEDEALRDELLRGIDDSIGRLRRLLDDLARLHEQLIGSLELELRPVDLNAWLPVLIAPWRQAARDRGLRWESDLAADLPVVPIDADRLGQALENLLSNAIKFTPSNGTVRVEAGVKNAEAWIRVSDSGPGIAVSDQDKVFTPHFRVHRDRRFPQGMGLGLSIARSLVVAHGGRLDLDSAPGLGSRFTLWLPLQPAYQSRTFEAAATSP